MNFMNYKYLCNAINEAQRAGADTEADWEILESSIQALVGCFQADAYSNVRAILHAESDSLDIQDTAVARDALNTLCERYGVPLVCAPAETKRETAADVASQVVALLTK